MSERLELLAARLESLPVPGGVMGQAQFSILKAHGKLLAQVPKVSGDVAQLRDTLATTNESINTMAGMLGEKHEGIIILRRMTAIATAIVEGKNEPTDAELDKQFGGSGGGGCFSVVLIISVGIGLFFGSSWLLR